MAYANVNVPKREIEKVRDLLYDKLMKTNIYLWFFTR